MNFAKSYFKLFLVVIVLILATLACTNATPKPTDPSAGAVKGRVEVQTTLPKNPIQQGKDFDISLSIRNPSQYDQHITGILLPAGFVKQSNYVGSDPNLTATRDASGNLSIALDEVIAPNGGKDIKFRFNSMNSGTLSGIGTLSTDTDTYQFDLRVEIEGNTNPGGWEPGVSPTTTPSPLGKIPYQAVVQIKAIIRNNGQDQVGWTGSGTIISKDGLILTNAHVVLAPRLYDLQYLIIALTLAQDQPPEDMFVAGIVQVDPELDIAVIKPSSDLNGNPINYSALDLPFVPIGDSNTLQLGDTITVLGYPGIGGQTITLTRGLVSGFTSEQPYGNRAWIKTTATISGGNSGGLALNDSGELIGVPSLVGSGDVNTGSIVDCRAIVDTNRDGVIDNSDTCVPTGGFINALRPVQLAMPLIQKAMAGLVSIDTGTAGGESFTGGGKVIFSDDFSDGNSGWSSVQTDTGAKGYLAGYYFISVTEENYLQWSTLDYSYDNLVMSVDAAVLTPAGDGDFGFICGARDSEHFWALEISEDGYYSIWKQDGEAYVALVDWTYADEVATSSDFRLEAFCGTQGLGLAVNGLLLDEVVDPDFAPAPVGLIAGTYSQAGVVVGFDNYQLSKP